MGICDSSENAFMKESQKQTSQRINNNPNSNYPQNLMQTLNPNNQNLQNTQDSSNKNNMLIPPINNINNQGQINTNVAEVTNGQNIDKLNPLLENEKKIMEQKINDIQNELNQKQNEIKSLKADNEKLKLDLEEKTIPITVGLDNIGATCYMNATLQCLSNVPELTDFFLQKFPSQMTNNKIMTTEYYKVIKELWNRDNNKKSYAPNSFKEVLSKENELFAGVAANDSKDLINFLLEQFHKELNVSKINNNMNNIISQNDQSNEAKMLSIFLSYMQEAYNSQISALFYGVQENITKCLNCNRLKYNYQIFSILEFPLEQVNKYCFNNGLRMNFNGVGNPDINLYECFQYYNHYESMVGENQIHCDTCNRLTNANYGTLLYSMPNYLIINLNRGKGATYKCNLIFPEILNLLNYVNFKDGNIVFQLHSVICHIGPSSMGGHFVAYCKHKLDNKWYKYNDSIVTLCENKKEYLNGLPYILFYQAINIEK